MRAFSRFYFIRVLTAVLGSKFVFVQFVSRRYPFAIPSHVLAGHPMSRGSYELCLHNLLIVSLASVKCALLKEL